MRYEHVIIVGLGLAVLGTAIMGTEAEIMKKSEDSTSFSTGLIGREVKFHIADDEFDGQRGLIVGAEKHDPNTIRIFVEYGDGNVGIAYLGPMYNQDTTLYVAGRDD